MDELTQYIKAYFAVLVAVLYCIGRGLKAIQRFPNQFIPLALTFCGIGLACLSVVSRYASYGNWAAALFEGVVQGVLCAGMSVYLNEAFSQIVEKTKFFDGLNGFGFPKPFSFILTCSGRQFAVQYPYKLCPLLWDTKERDTPCTIYKL